MTVPAATIRVYNKLRDGGTHTAYELAEACFTDKRHVQNLLKLFRACGLAHRAGWIRPERPPGPTNRAFIARWAYGCREDAPKPARIANAVARRKRLERLKEQFGSEVANQILLSRKEGGTSVLKLEGEVVFRRGKPRGKYIRDKQGVQA